MQNLPACEHHAPDIPQEIGTIPPIPYDMYVASSAKVLKVEECIQSIGSEEESEDGSEGGKPSKTHEVTTLCDI